VKGMRFLFLSTACALWIGGATYAAPSQQMSHEPQAPTHASHNSHPRSRTSLPAANHPKQLALGGKRSTPGNAAGFPQQASHESATSAMSASLQKEPSNRALPGRQKSLTRPMASLNPSFNGMRHRGPNPAVVLGSANSNRSNAGAINGTGVKRRR